MHHMNNKPESFAVLSYTFSGVACSH